MEENLNELSLQELESLLVRLKHELEDLEDTFNFNLANTPDHHNEAMLREHEDEMEEFRQHIESVSAVINKKKAGIGA